MHKQNKHQIAKACSHKVLYQHAGSSVGVTQENMPYCQHNSDKLTH